MQTSTAYVSALMFLSAIFGAMLTLFVLSLKRERKTQVYVSFPVRDLAEERRKELQHRIELAIKNPLTSEEVLHEFARKASASDEEYRRLHPKLSLDELYASSLEVKIAECLLKRGGQWAKTFFELRRETHVNQG